MVLKQKQHYYNNSLADIVLNNNELVKIAEEDDKFVRRKDPIFMIPENQFGRAHYYAPVKRLGSFAIDTYWFNVLVLWFFSGLLYATLMLDTWRVVVKYFEIFKFRRLARRISRYLPK
jgi:hypothetical protein